VFREFIIRHYHKICRKFVLRLFVNRAPDWFDLSGAGLPRLSWQGGREIGVCLSVGELFLADMIMHLSFEFISAGSFIANIM